MLLNTKHFGEIEVNEKDIFFFEDGLFAFENIKKYVVIKNSDPEVPFHWLQAIENTDLAFVITNPFLFKNDYEFDIPEKVINQLSIEKKEDILLYSIVVVPEDLKKMSINLKGPVIMNQAAQKGKQIALEKENYPTKFYIFQEDREQAGK